MSRVAAPFLLLLLLPLLVPGARAAAEIPPPPRAPLHRASGLFLLGGKPIGYYRQLTVPDGMGGFRTEVFQRMVIARAGARFTITRRETWLEGEALRRMEAQTDMNGQPQRLEARTAAAGIEVTQESGGSVQRRTLPADGRILGPYLSARAVAEAARHGYESVEYRAFLADDARVDRVVVRLLGEGAMADSSGRTHRGVLTEERSAAYPGIVTRAVLDPQEGICYSRIPMGFAMEMVRSDLSVEEAEALLGEADGSAASLDVLSLGIPVEGLRAVRSRVPRMRSARFRFRGEGVGLLEAGLRSAAAELGAGKDAPAEWEGGGAAGILEVRLRAPQPPASVADPDPAAAAAVGYTAGGFYLDLDDPRLEDLLAGARREGRLDPARLSDRVFRAIWKKSTRFGFAGLREVLDSREGDCTEHAVLLVGLLRRAGYPARLAYGFVLMEEDGFVGHAWTEAFLDGRWQWLDPSFPGAESRRLRIRLGALDPAEPLTGEMTMTLLQVAGAVRAEILEYADEEW